MKAMLEEVRTAVFEQIINKVYIIWIMRKMKKIIHQERKVVDFAK